MADASSADMTATESFVTNAQQDQTTIGPELRRIRKEQNRTLQSVADAAGVTKGFLSLLERNKCQVSVPTLLNICTALKIHLKDLFHHPSSKVVDSGAPFEMGGIGIQEFLLTPVDEEYLQVMRTVIEPGGGSGGAYSSDTETIFVLVLRGSILLIVDGERRNLEVGSSTTFRARDTHEWYNTFDGETEVVWAVSPPWNMASHDIRKRPANEE